MIFLIYLEVSSVEDSKNVVKIWKFEKNDYIKLG